MKIQINSVNISYTNGVEASVQVHFEGHDEAKTMNFNGYKTITPTEYTANSTVEKLGTLVKQSINDGTVQELP